MKRIRRIRPAPGELKPGMPYYEALNAYRERFLPLIQAEQLEEEAELRERLGTWPLDKLKAEGYTLTGLSAYWLEKTRFGKPLASFSLGPGQSLPNNRFANGTQILLSRIDPLTESASRGSVLFSGPSYLTISFPDRSVDLDISPGEEGWRIDLGQSQYVYDQMRNAIAAFENDVGKQEMTFLPSPTTPEQSTAKNEQYVLRGTYLRDVLLRSFEPSEHPHTHRPLQDPDAVDYVQPGAIDHEYDPTRLSESMGETTLGEAEEVSKEHGGAFKDNMLIQSWAKRYSKPDPVVVAGDPSFKEFDGLNSTQKRAMAMMIGERISLVQGPPGTGKTLTIIATIKLLKAFFAVPQPLLVCTYTNVAVDNLVEGLAKAGLKPLRASSTGQSKPSLRQWTLEEQLEKHELRPEWKQLVARIERIDKELKGLNQSVSDLERKSRDGLSKRESERLSRMLEDLVKKERSLEGMNRRKYAMEQEMIKDVIDQSDVICTTCITAASAVLNIVDFPVVFLDEASMSTEPASLIPLMKGSRHVALIGDHKQLPPVVTSPEAQAHGFATSLFERLTEEKVVPSIMLNIQYRMHPAISQFPSLEFYNSRLLDGTVDGMGYVSDRLEPPYVSPMLLPPGVPEDEAQKFSTDRGSFHTSSHPPVIFLDHDGNESIQAKSRVNWNEAYIVASVVEDLLLNNESLRGEDIGIIAPYVAQISLLTRLFSEDVKYRERFNSVLGEHRAMQLANIEIKTVDGFEGREKEVIIFSTVRNNPGGYIGFLADRRRLNVGLTRAKRGLFIVGSISTLRQGRTSSEEGVMKARVGKGAESWRRYVSYLGELGWVLDLQAQDTLTKVLYGNIQNFSPTMAGLTTPGFDAITGTRKAAAMAKMESAERNRGNILLP